jgi:hypothetical protein
MASRTASSYGVVRELCTTAINDFGANHHKAENAVLSVSDPNRHDLVSLMPSAPATTSLAGSTRWISTATRPSGGREI